MKYTSTTAVTKQMAGKMALYRECYFTNSTKPW